MVRYTTHYAGAAGSREQGGTVYCTVQVLCAGDRRGGEEEEQEREKGKGRRSSLGLLVVVVRQQQQGLG
jgi:hypothetical protein